MICEYYYMCAFMQQKIRTDPVTASVIERSYCASDKCGCARYCLFQIVAAERVPDHLWPSDEVEAMEVIEDAFRSSGRPRACLEECKLR